MNTESELSYWPNAFKVGFDLWIWDEWPIYKSTHRKIKNLENYILEDFNKFLRRPGPSIPVSARMDNEKSVTATKAMHAQIKPPIGPLNRSPQCSATAKRESPRRSEKQVAAAVDEATVLFVGMVRRQVLEFYNA